jgi:hypothetical protein
MVRLGVTQFDPRCTHRAWTDDANRRWKATLVVPEVAAALERTVAHMVTPWAAEGWPAPVDETGRAVTA